MMYLYCSISWYHKPVRVRSRVAFLASLCCAICYFCVLLKSWCCYCTCESKTDRRGMLCHHEMPKHELHLKLIFRRLELMFFHKVSGFEQSVKMTPSDYLAWQTWFLRVIWVLECSHPFYSFSFHLQLISHGTEPACLMLSFSAFSWLILALPLFCLVLVLVFPPSLFMAFWGSSVVHAEVGCLEHQQPFGRSRFTWCILMSCV